MQMKFNISVLKTIFWVLLMVSRAQPSELTRSSTYDPSSVITNLCKTIYTHVFNVLHGLYDGG
jgi:hypothetical protein